MIVGVSAFYAIPFRLPIVVTLYGIKIYYHKTSRQKTQCRCFLSFVNALFRYSIEHVKNLFSTLNLKIMVYKLGSLNELYVIVYFIYLRHQLYMSQCLIG